MVEAAQGLHGIGSGDPAIFDHDQVVAVVLLTARRDV